MAILTIILGLALLGGIGWARNLGPVLPVANGDGNQQNPAVVAIPDKGYWFVAWENWQENGLESDIYGAFVRIKEVEDEDCSLPRIFYQGKCYEGLEICAGPFVVEGGDGYNQYRPSVAYDHRHGKLLVVWQDDRWPYLKFRILDTPDACEEPIIHGLQSVPFNPTRDCTTCQGTCVCATPASYRELCESNGNHWNPCDGQCYAATFSVETNEECTNPPNGNPPGLGGTWCSGDKTCYRDHLTYQTLCEEGSGDLLWDETNDRCLRRTRYLLYREDLCQDRFYFENNISYPFYPNCSAALCENVCNQNFMETMEDECRVAPQNLDLDALLSRKYARVVYNPHDQAFWFGWLEKRKGRNRVREGGCGLIGETVSGEGILPAYGKLDVSSGGIDWSNLNDRWEKVGDLSTESKYATMSRRLSSGDSEDGPNCERTTICSISYEHELFANTGKLDLAPNTSEGGVTLVWSGTRELVYLTFCRYGDGKTEFLTSSKFEPEEKLIWAIHSDNIHTSGWPSKQISEVGPAYHPSIEFDPVTNRYLVVWEDSRATGINTPKIYGQLLDGLETGLYHANFPLALEEQLGDGWAYLKQTNPYVEWDPINQRFFVAWQDNRAGTVSIENIDIWGQYVDSEGSLRGENLLISATEAGQPTAGNQLAPQVAYDPALGIYLAVWKDARHYGETGSDIYVQAFSVGQSQLTLLDKEHNPLHPTVLDFGSLRVGERKSIVFYLRNTGDTVLKICELSLLEDPFSYLLLSQVLSDGNEATCLSLQPGMEEKIMIEFSPLQEGSFSQTIKIASDAGERTLIIQGGVRPVITASQTHFDFDEVLVGNVRSYSFTLINHSEEDIEIRNVSISSGAFSIEGLTIGSTIPAGEAINAQIVFRPENPSVYTGEATLTFSKGGSLSLVFSGIGKKSPLYLEPGELNFGTLRIGNTKTLSFKISNHGDGPFILTNIEGIEPPFELKGLEVGSELSPGSSLEGEVIFSPGERGLYEQELRLVFQQEDEIVSVTYFLKGEALELPACFFTNLPAKVMLHEGASPLWFFLVTGDDDLFLSRFQEPALLKYTFLISEPGNYLLALYPSQELEPYTYRDRIALLFVGAKRPLEAKTNLILSGPPLGWSSYCVPVLSLFLNGKRALRFKNGALPGTLTLSLELSWPCAPSSAQVGEAYLKVISPTGKIYYYDLLEGFVPYLRKYRVSPPISFQDDIVLPLPPYLEEGLWLFELSLRAGGEYFYNQAGVVVIEKLPDTFCQTVDLAD